MEFFTAEMVDLTAQGRRDYLYGLLRWSDSKRRVALTLCLSGGVLRLSEISARAYVSRNTTRRTLSRLCAAGLVSVSADGFVTTRLGAAFIAAAERDVQAIVWSGQRGFSRGFLESLRALDVAKGLDYDLLSSVRFPPLCRVGRP